MRPILLKVPRPFGLPARGSWAWIVFVWSPVLMTVAVIAIESTDTFSARNTSSWLRPIVEAVLGRFADDTWEEVHHLARKTGHFVGYGLVCLSFLRAWLYTLVRRGSYGVRGWRLRSSALAVACTAVIASLDELHQATLPSRTGKFSDVVLDTCGATVACVILWLLFWRGERD